MQSSRVERLVGGVELNLRDAIEILFFGFPVHHRADLHAAALCHLGRQAANAGARLGERAAKFLETCTERRDDPRPGDRDAAPCHCAAQTLPAVARAEATWRSRSASVLMPLRSSSETWTSNSSSTLNMNSMKLSESMPSESSGALGSSPSGSIENSFAARALMRASVSIEMHYSAYNLRT